MSFKKIQYEQSSGVVLQVEKESTGFIPFQVTTGGANTQGTFDVGGNLTVLGSGNFEVENGTSIFGGAVTFADTTTFNSTANFTSTVTFSTNPTGLVPDTRSVFTSGGLTGGGNLTTNRTLQIASLGVTTGKINSGAVTTAKINDGAVTTVKINDGAVSYDKLATSAAVRIDQALANGYNITTNTITGVNIPTYVGGGTLNFTFPGFSGGSDYSRIVQASIRVIQSGSTTYYSGDAANSVASPPIPGCFWGLNTSSGYLFVEFNSGGKFDSASFNNATIVVTAMYIS